MKSILTAFSALLLVTSAAFAADASGKWKGSFEVPGGPVLTLTFDLKAVDGAVTGTVTGMLEKAIEIKDGKVQGDTISFWLMSEYQGNPIKLVYSGKVADDQIKLTMGTEDGGWSTEILAKKSS